MFVSQGINFLIPEEVSNYIKLHYGNVPRSQKPMEHSVTFKKIVLCEII